MTPPLPVGHSPLASLMKYVSDTSVKVFVVMCVEVPDPVFSRHAVGEVVTWSTSKRAALKARDAQWEPSLYQVIKMERVQ